MRTAWLDAQTAFQRLDLTNQLLAQASRRAPIWRRRATTSDSSSIVELTQAQLNKTRAELEQAAARYDYQARMAALQYPDRRVEIEAGLSKSDLVRGHAVARKVDVAVDVAERRPLGD